MADPMEPAPNRSECSPLRRCNSCAVRYKLRPSYVGEAEMGIPEVDFGKIWKETCTILAIGASVVGAIVRTRAKGKHNGSTNHGRRG